jgi:biopolymer transport protein ExbB
VSGTLNNFPVLVSLTDADLAASASLSGADFCFTDSTGVTALPFEIERWTKANGSLVAWVALPSVTPSQNATFYIHYGGTGPAMTIDPALVWDANYAAVYHLGEVPSPNYADSTAHNNTGANAGPVAATGRVAQAASFDGSNDVIDCGSDASIDNVLRGGGTLEAWIYAVGWGESSYGRILDKSNAVTPDGGWGFYVNDATRGASLGLSHSFGMNFTAWFPADNVLTLDAWHHVAVTYNSDDMTAAPTFYVDGMVVTSSRNLLTSAPGNNPDSDAMAPLLIGNAAGGTTRTFNGSIDEVRVSTAIRSPQWLATSHANQANPATFLSAGPQEATL